MQQYCAFGFFHNLIRYFKTKIYVFPEEEHVPVPVTAISWLKSSCIKSPVHSKTCPFTFCNRLAQTYTTFLSLSFDFVRYFMKTFIKPVLLGWKKLICQNNCERMEMGVTNGYFVTPHFFPQAVKTIKKKWTGKKEKKQIDFFFLFLFGPPKFF